MPKTVISVVGARPQFIKSFPLSAAFTNSKSIEEKILHTGQHFDDNMSEVFFRELNIPAPTWRLETGGGTHGAMTGQMIEQIETILLDNKPSALLVYGDTNSTLAGTLAAVKLAIPVIHVEAGLRSHNFYQPEELNRVLTDRVSELLLPPTQTAVSYLEKENVPGRIELVGDLMYDSTLQAISLLEKIPSNVREKAGISNQSPYVMITLHRAENVDDETRFRNILKTIHESAEGRKMVFPIHPRTMKMAKEMDIDLSDFQLLDPIGYLESVDLLRGADVLFTDSGGMQKEAYFCQTSCVTMRDETEWVETIDAGWNRLWTEKNFLHRSKTDAFGDGHAAQKTVSIIEDFLS